MSAPTLTTISIPELALVALIGPSGCGKSTFGRTHFKPTEVLSSDYCRGLVSDDENDQAATGDAFDVLYHIAGKRLKAGLITVIDATNVQEEARKKIINTARNFHVIPVAIVLDLPEELCQNRNRERPDRNFGPHVIRQQRQQLKRSLRNLKREGFRHIYVLHSPEEVAAVQIERTPLWNNRKFEHGPFDIIGDVHGCADELEKLLAALGYRITEVREGAGFDSGPVYQHPEGRKALFLGDLVDRGPRILDTLKIVRNMMAADAAHCVPGNHDMKFMRKLRGKNVTVNHGLDKSIAEIDALPEEIRPQYSNEVAEFLDSLVSHYVFDDGKLVVAHAGLKEELQGRGSGKVRDFCLYGETTGETDEYGLPVRHNWAADYRGKALMVYGHTPVPEPEWLNKTICVDTGCVFGGSMTALRYPEKELVSVPAAKEYCSPAKPLKPVEESPGDLSAQQAYDDLLDIDDVLGKRIIATSLRHNVTIREEQAIAALEAMSRFAANPKWLIYLPPTMSPSETSQMEGLLEHPQEAFAYYRKEGVAQVVCEEKHMGSRTVIVLCRNEAVARDRFGVTGEGIGICYTRRGRRFFDENDALEHQLLERLNKAIEAAGLWEELQTDWICLDCELMPWSAKAQELLRQQYAAVGAASKVGLGSVITLLQGNQNPALDLNELVADYQDRLRMAGQYTEAYRHYCWPVNSIDDLKLAPFHILATEGKLHTNQSHVWHMETLARICKQDEKLLVATPFKVIDVADPDSVQIGIRWWEDLTRAGGEGMVVKPMDFIVTGKKGLVQPAVKCRGPEYLRIIYGPEYTRPEHIRRLRERGLSAKRSLALREFALGIESLERFIRKEPLRKVHECVFGVLALESEPVDPRL